MKFEFEDHGVEHAQYFQGVGTAFTDWDSVYVGIGSSAREAAEDAAENASQSMDSAEFAAIEPAIDMAIAEMSEERTVADDDAGEIAHHVALFIGA
jgi:hypothetical protein